ncbi:SpaA isopeptide-forming pilin-related protein [Candidatus Nitrosotalea bavarica]|uniref:SpaA isopeptide-forming pilin-related protein n=1 Tax=Candidatus Nitrosotalea bavarica TaxID=1903277 RepID=UPI000C6FF8CB|nr:hypothetical protein [Candidatus Nitrosotalea bavarica]
MKRLSKITYIFAISSFVLVLYLVSNSGIYHSTNSVFAQNSSLTIISLSNDNKLIGASQFVISPNPFTGTGNYTIVDNGPDDTEKDKDGVITLSGIKNGNYIIIQTGTMQGFSVDQIQKTVQVNNSSGVVTFTDLPINNAVQTSSSRSVTYTTKFECGSIYAGEGPLRPGHYDTDISLFNKQKFQTQVLWNSVPTNGSSSNALLMKMDSETAKSITCKDIRNSLGDYNENFIEGFTIIDVPLDSMLNSGMVTSSTSNDINILDVQAFYTANALDMLPHEVIVDKISFYIIQDQSGKIPANMINKTLDISMPSGLNQISDTEKKVKNALARQYTLSDDDLTKIVIKVKDVAVGVGVLIDDHAISLSTVKPELGS